ncbi:sulfotransferase [Sedimentitalea sp. JM2-8]|uniref:Sulfotransferase n=1 Tax=Sedimentitalea xiamensis TaxID=3050037 RepID=A0ABT7FHF4_9RHOB|nr:sulfotransferase [Sedimentitalea xiamensis]MDK3074543.1 sulfotransferase [Sedimentitalea xiamensis]
MNIGRFPDLKGTLFIVTYGRSGSTLLQSLLQTIPGAHIAGENHNTLEGLFRAGQSARQTLRDWGQQEQPANHPWHNADRIDPGRFEKALAKAFVQNVLKPPQNARWIGFKEIRTGAVNDEFAAFLNFHRRNFPNPFFVFNSRNAEDVANSSWWKDEPRADVLHMIRKLDDRYADFAAKNPNCSHHVFHEETVKNPISLRPLFDKLGEPLDLPAVAQVMERRLTH